MSEYSNRSRHILWISAGCVALLLGIFYWFADPATSRFMPKCLWHTLTGLDCPGCGAQRMAHALLHADLKGAWSANPMLLCMLPLIGIGIWADLRPRWARRFFYHPATLWTISIAIVAWGVLRNIF